MKQETCGDFGLVAERQWRNVEAADQGSGTPSTALRIRSQAWLARTLSTLEGLAEGRRYGEEALRLYSRSASESRPAPPWPLLLISTAPWT
jgi:hypothetical protein